MKITGLLFALIAVASTAGCRVESSSSHATPYRPSLEAFHVVDSYGTSTEDEIDPVLRLNPYIDGGQFEFYWYADNVDDYTIEFRINDVPSIRGSRLVSSDYCGIDLDCDLEGIQFCEYYADFSMSCDPPGTKEPNKYVTHFDDLVFSLPETLYLILDLCDTQSDYCEYQTLEVLLE